MIQFRLLDSGKAKNALYLHSKCFNSTETKWTLTFIRRLRIKKRGAGSSGRAGSSGVQGLKEHRGARIAVGTWSIGSTGAHGAQGEQGAQGA